MNRNKGRICCAVIRKEKKLFSKFFFTWTEKARRNYLIQCLLDYVIFPMGETANESALNIATPLLCIVPRGTNNISVDYLIICKLALWEQMAKVPRKGRKSTEVLSELLREVTGCLPAFYRTVDSFQMVRFMNKCLNKQSGPCKKKRKMKRRKWRTAVNTLWTSVYHAVFVQHRALSSFRDSYVKIMP